MKKLIVIAAITALVGGAAFAQSNQVLSRNAVGYVKSTVDRGGYQLVSLNFESLDGGGLYVDDVVGDQLPASSVVYIWDQGANKYQTEAKSERSGWQPNTNPIVPGVGFWLEVPGTAASNSYDVYLMGEVPASTNFVTTIPANLNCVGYSYPTDVIWTNTELAKTLPASSLIYIWNGAGYDTYAKSSRSGWSTAPDLVLHPGQGFWVENSGSQFDWDQAKPYTWP